MLLHRNIKAVMKIFICNNWNCCIVDETDVYYVFTFLQHVIKHLSAVYTQLRLLDCIQELQLLTLITIKSQAVECIPPPRPADPFNSITPKSNTYLNQLHPDFYSHQLVLRHKNTPDLIPTLFLRKEQWNSVRVSEKKLLAPSLYSDLHQKWMGSILG